MTNLRKVILRNESFTHIPQQLFYLNNLVELSLEWNLINSIPESSLFNDAKKNVFEKSSKGTFVGRILQQFIMIFSSSGGEGGLFIFVGKKNN